MEQVTEYGTALTVRELDTVLRALRSYSGPGRTTVLDHFEWMRSGIETNDRDMTPVVGERDESPSDFGEFSPSTPESDDLTEHTFRLRVWPSGFGKGMEVVDVRARDAAHARRKVIGRKQFKGALTSYPLRVRDFDGGR